MLTLTHPVVSQRRTDKPQAVNDMIIIWQCIQILSTAIFVRQHFQEYENIFINFYVDMTNEVIFSFIIVVSSLQFLKVVRCGGNSTIVIQNMYR